MLANGQFESLGAANAAAELGERPRAIVQSAVPFILAGGTAGGGLNQFTMGDNGAISTLPVLPTTYSGGAWLYLPAGAIFAGSAAGWYWFVASSTTAGTVFNNTYTAGDPILAIPASPIPFVSTGPGLITQETVSTITALNRQLFGGALGKNGSLAMDVIISVAPTASNRVWEVRLGATPLMGTSNFSATTTGARHRGRMHNRNSFSSQISSGFTGFSNVTTAGGTYYTSINTAVDQTLEVRLRIVDAVGNFAILEAASMLIEYAP